MTSKEFIDNLKFGSSVTRDRWIIITNQDISDFIQLTDDVNIENRISIKNCTFHGQFIITNWVFENYIEFDHCVFRVGLWINGGTFKRNFELHNVTAESLCLNGGNFTQINLSIKKVGQVWLNAGKFESLNLGGSLIGNNDFNSLTILNNSELDGNINILNKSIKDITLSGNNSGRDYTFQNIKCEHFTIKNFINTGNLKIYGLEPMIANNCYIKIVKSNLGKSQLFRIGFNNFNEVIIVDSYLSELNIINSNWDFANFKAPREPENQTEISNEKAKDSFELKQLKENFRQLKYVYEKQGDKIRESYFYSLEMNTYNSLLNWDLPHKEIFWEKLILTLSKSLTNYGSSFKRPLIGILLSTWIILVIQISVYGFQDLNIVLPWNNDSNACRLAIGEYFKLLNPLHKMNDSLEGWAIMWDLISRIFASYFIYGLVRSSRKFLR